MVKIFADSANINSIRELNPSVAGFTTNPALMKKAGIINLKGFAEKVIPIIEDKPLSIEVLSDNPLEMIEEAKEISTWGDNIYIKIPITNSKGQTTYHVVEALTLLGIKVNVTAVMTIDQVRYILPALMNTKGAYISVFAGRIADTGVNPIPVMGSVSDLLPRDIELIWASPREVLNVYQANVCGCDIITCSSEIIKKLHLYGKDLTEYSLETVQMFLRDAEGICIR